MAPRSAPTESAPDVLTSPKKPPWTFLTNHAHVLVCIAGDPGMRLRDVAERVGITERAAQSIVADLVGAGYLTRNRVGRRNHYQVHPELPLRHPVEAHRSVGGLLGFVAPPAAAATPSEVATRGAATRGSATKTTGAKPTTPPKVRSHATATSRH